MWVDFRVAENFGFLVGKKFGLGKVMICKKKNKNNRQEFGKSGKFETFVCFQCV